MTTEKEFSVYAEDGGFCGKFVAESAEEAVAMAVNKYGADDIGTPEAVPPLELTVWRIFNPRFNNWDRGTIEAHSAEEAVMIYGWVSDMPTDGVFAEIDTGQVFPTPLEGND